MQMLREVEGGSSALRCGLQGDLLPEDSVPSGERVTQQRRHLASTPQPGDQDERPA